jgi:hypothetical protein
VIKLGEYVAVKNHLPVIEQMDLQALGMISHNILTKKMMLLSTLQELESIMSVHLMETPLIRAMVSCVAG